MEKFELIAPCYFGTESTTAFEVRRLGAENVQVTDGRVAFSGGADIIAAANLNLRCAERVLMLLKTYDAFTFDELFDGVYAIPWEELIPKDGQFPVKGSSLSSQLSSVPACQSIVKKAVVKRLMDRHKVSTLPEDGALFKIRFSIRKNKVEIMLDTTGDGLHKRGYRRNSTIAPIKETLAAAIADLGRVRRDTLMEDPFCGSGTMVIEAAQKAMNIAPGLRRRFAAEHYGFIPASVWSEQRGKCLSEVRLDAAFEAYGFDIDPAAVELAAHNAKLAGVDGRCHFKVADVRDFKADPAATILTNPPYGERLGDLDEAAELARVLGERWRMDPGSGLYVITADMEFESHFGGRAARRRKLYNGMIPCQVYMYYGNQELPPLEEKKESAKNFRGANRTAEKRNYENKQGFGERKAFGEQRTAGSFNRERRPFKNEQKAFGDKKPFKGNERSFEKKSFDRSESKPRFERKEYKKFNEK